MSLSPDIRRQVRQRAGYACEFCGVSEVDVGGLLTVDHFHPQSKGGNDNLDNLIYSCANCNQYKQDYYPASNLEPQLWNPRTDKDFDHLVELETGQMEAISPCGEFTIQRLRLNRSQLVAYRKSRRQREEQVRLLKRYRALVELLSQVNGQLSDLMEEQQQLLEAQRALMRILLNRQS